VEEASHRILPTHSAPTIWSTLPVSHRNPLIALLVQLAQRRLTRLAAEVHVDERRRTGTAR
jgi:hypothetical protein